MTEAVENNATETTEAVETEASPSSYEGIRDASPVILDRVRSAWQLADKQALRLREEYDRIAGNEELTDEAKQQKALNAYERNAQKIADSKQQARQAFLVLDVYDGPTCSVLGPETRTRLSHVFSPAPLSCAQGPGPSGLPLLDRGAADSLCIGRV